MVNGIEDSRKVAQSQCQKEALCNVKSTHAVGTGLAVGNAAGVTIGCRGGIASCKSALTSSACNPI